MLTVTRLTADLARTLDFHLITHVNGDGQPSSRQYQEGGSASTRTREGGGHMNSQLSSRSPRLIPCDDPDVVASSSSSIMNHPGGLKHRSRGGTDDNSGHLMGVGGGGVVGISGASSRPRGQTLTTRADPNLMAQYLRPIKRSKSICEQILDYFFA